MSMKKDLGLVQHDTEPLMATGQILLLTLQRRQDAPVSLLLLLHKHPSDQDLPFI